MGGGGWGECAWVPAVAEALDALLISGDLMEQRIVQTFDVVVWATDLETPLATGRQCSD